MALKLFANIKGTDRIDLPELGIWIEVRKELSHGEKKRVFQRAFRGMTQLADGEVRNDVDPVKMSLGLISAYITDWNATTEQDGKVVAIPYSLEALEQLTTEAYAVIEKAVDKYTEAAKEVLGEAQPAQSAEPMSSSVAG